MGDYLVYSPFTGQTIALDCYCNRPNCPPHPVVMGGEGHCCPLDVSAPQGAWIYAYLSAAILSVKIEYRSGPMCLSEGGVIDDGVLLHAYTGFNATGKYLGRLLYGHVSNPQNNGATINKYGGIPWIVTIGQVPSVPSGCIGNSV